MLTKIFNDTALIVIDVQRCFAEPAPEKACWGTEETDRISGDIAAALPQYRQAGIPVYLVRYDPNRYNPEADAFYKIKRMQQDVVIFKHADSAFKGSDIENILREDGRMNTLVCGFNFSGCVSDTAIDAVAKRFNVTVLEDLSANCKGFSSHNRENTARTMRENGIKLDTSKNILDNIKKKQLGRAA